MITKKVFSGHHTHEKQNFNQLRKKLTMRKKKFGLKNNVEELTSDDAADATTFINFA
jgi:hypothetical protein